MIATLTVVAGPMFAGKTSALIARIVEALDRHQQPVVIVKPAMDNRYAEAAIVTHDGVAHPALPIASEHDLFAAVAEAAAIGDHAVVEQGAFAFADPLEAIDNVRQLGNVVAFNL